MVFYWLFYTETAGCEGDLAATPVTPLTARVDSVDLAGEEGVPFLPHRSMCVPPEAAHSVQEDDLPDQRRGLVFGQGYTSSCAPLLEPPNKVHMERPVSCKKLAHTIIETSPRICRVGHRPGDSGEPVVSPSPSREA